MPNHHELARELEKSLWRDLVQHWFPRCVDPDGGFHQNFDREWNLGANSGKFVVFQSRLTWVAATLEEACPESGEYIEYMEHGTRFLLDRLEDKEHGGFVWWIGEPDNRFRQRPDQKVTYGISFALFALAAAARIGDTEALLAAKRTFHWLEEHCHDEEHGGYFELTERDGTPVVQSLDPEATRRDGIANPYGLKTHNTSLHLMEAFTELYRVWPDEHLRRRIIELIGILTGPFVQPNSRSVATLTRDLKPATDTTSFGHDIEAAHLLIDSATRVGERLPIEVASGFGDYVLKEGWDDLYGGIYYFGNLDGTVTSQVKSWWAVAEALPGYAELYRQTGDDRYLNAMHGLWEWIWTKQIDHEHGGWFGNLSREGEVTDGGVKAQPWKAFYHETRALLSTARILRSLSD